jgi:hypothetical protein
MSKIPKPEELFEDLSQEETEILNTTRDVLLKEMQKRRAQLKKDGSIYVDEPEGAYRVFDRLAAEFRAQGWQLVRTPGRQEQFIEVRVLASSAQDFYDK